MTTTRNVLGRDRSPSGPSGGNDPGRDRSPSGPSGSPNVPSDPTRPPDSHSDIGALGESALPRCTLPRPSRGIDLGRDGSPSRPSGHPPIAHSDIGALGESALPRCALPRSSGGNDLGRDHSPSGPSGETALPKRKRLSHQVPPWVAEGATFFITVNCLPRGGNQLTVPAMAAGLAESVFVRGERGNWWSKLLLFMPDHVHTLMVFAPDRLMLRVISDWKRYTARHLGIRWQRDFFDHRIRTEESLAEKWDYIFHNPVRAGLVGRPEEWPYVWFGDDIGRDRSPSGPTASPGGNDPGRDGSPSRPPGSPSRPKASPSDPPDSGDLGRDGSPSRPLGRPPISHPDIGALGESALPRFALPRFALPRTLR